MWEGRSTAEDTASINHKDVLEGLKPHGSLKVLKLEKFEGQNFASWMMSGRDAQLLQNLVKIEFSECTRCEQVPPLGHLPHLEVIRMYRLSNLKCIGSEFYGCHSVVNHDQCNDGIITGSYSGAVTTATAKAMAVVFPALRELYLDDMENLEEWCGLWVSSSSSDTIMFFPLLEFVRIRDCPELTTIPGHLLSLQELICGDHPETHRPTHRPYLRIASRGLKMGVLLVDFLEKSSKTLRKMTVISLKELCYLPKGLFQQTLVTLEIQYCPNLIIADPDELCSLPSLQSLTIIQCPRLADCWEERLFCLTSLQTLKIGFFLEELEYFPWPSTTVSAASASASKYHPNPKHYPFISLVSLTLLGWKRLKYLPDQLQHLTTLRDLSISQFHGLEALPEWLGNISSLHSLELHRCDANRPTQEAMQRLTNLQSLKIYNCPLLKERCARGSGQEWHKIAHIPSIHIRPY